MVSRLRKFRRSAWLFGLAGSSLAGQSPLPVDPADWIRWEGARVTVQLHAPASLDLEAVDLMGRRLGAPWHCDLPAGLTTISSPWKHPATPCWLRIGKGGTGMWISPATPQALRTLHPSDGMRLVPAGTYQVGSPTSEAGRYADEMLHTAQLSAFWIDTTPVTRQSFRDLVGRDLSPAACGDPRCPADSLTWFDAVLYCNARSRAEGFDTAYRYDSVDSDSTGSAQFLDGIALLRTADGYRLPSEAQWEAAARHGTDSAWPWQADSATSLAWFLNNAEGIPHPVATRPPSPWGLSDVGGNVWEWVEDWYAAYDTALGTDPIQEKASLYRCFRGGSFADSLPLLRCAFRNAASPDYSAGNLGLRCVRPVLAQ
jgi:formylglycine-generating enzyme required for sulfatase activity